MGGQKRFVMIIHLSIISISPTFLLSLFASFLVPTPFPLINPDSEPEEPEVITWCKVEVAEVY